jgi:hypothetical protein
LLVAGVALRPRAEDRAVSILNDRKVRVMRLARLVDALGRIGRDWSSKQPPDPPGKLNLAAPWLQLS